MTPTIRSLIPLCLLMTLAVLFGCDSNSDPVVPPDGTLSGVVETSEGSGVSGATVTLSRSGESDRSTQSGSNGNFSISNLAAGSWTLDLDPPSGYELDDSHSVPVEVQIEAGATTQVTLLVAPEDSNGSGNNVVVIDALSFYAFDPDDLTIEPGTTIRWVNDANVAHTVTPDGHETWEEATLSSQGDTFEHTFDSEGTFEYECIFHLAEGMTGVVRVESSGG